MTNAEQIPVRKPSCTLRQAYSLQNNTLPQGEPSSPEAKDFTSPQTSKPLHSLYLAHGPSQNLDCPQTQVPIHHHHPPTHCPLAHLALLRHLVLLDVPLEVLELLFQGLNLGLVVVVRNDRVLVLRLLYGGLDSRLLAGDPPRCSPPQTPRTARRVHPDRWTQLNHAPEPAEQTCWCSKPRCFIHCFCSGVRLVTQFENLSENLCIRQ